MKPIFLTLTIAALFAGCLLDDKDSRIQRDMRGRVADLDSLYQYEGSEMLTVRRLPVKDVTYTVWNTYDCTARSFFGYSSTSATVGNPDSSTTGISWSRPDFDLESEDFRLFVPADSAFTHYRVKVDCIPPKD